MPTNQLLVNGKFSDEELAELQAELKEDQIVVCKYITKGIDVTEIVRMIFHNFDAIALLRDGILFGILTKLFDKTVKWAKAKKPSAEIQTTFELNLSEDKPIITVSIPFNQKSARDELERVLTINFIDSLHRGEIVSITWDKDKNGIKIIRF